jgi:TRAP-type C4-dicarboxylate transport system permease small subunit
MLIGVGLFHGALVILGGCWVWSTRGSYTSALQWPLNLFFYAALPCSAALALWYAIRRLIRGEFSETASVSEDCPTLDNGGDTCNS